MPEATLQMKKKTQGKRPRVTAEQILDMTSIAFRYALGRETYAVNAVTEIITKNWELFEKFEKDDFVEKIKIAVSTTRYGNLATWHKWRKILELHKDTTVETLRVFDAIVFKNERKK